MSDPQVLPGEHTNLQFKVATVYTTIGQLLTVKPPGGTVEAVGTTGLASVAKTFRPGLIPEVGEVEFTIQYDPNNTLHISLASRVQTPVLDNWKVVYVDGMATPACDTFDGFVTKFDVQEVEGETAKNLEATLTVQVTGVVVHTPGTA